MKSAEQRKQESLALLRQQKIPYLESLPVIETADFVRLRSAEEISRRAISCLLTIQLACDCHQQQNVEQSKLFMTGLLDQFGVRLFLTEKEKAVFNGTATRQDLTNMIWKYEAYWVLLWALGRVSELSYPMEICDCEKAIEVVSGCATFEEFVAAAQLRSIEEILDQADLIYRYDWACTNARIHGMPMPPGLNPEIVLERHWGLNWLIDADHGNDWDHVRCDT